MSTKKATKRPEEPRTPPVLASELVGARRPEVLVTSANWRALNRRRVELTEKELAESLGMGEGIELLELEASMSDYLDAVAPVSYSALDVMRRQLQELSDEDE